MGDTKLIIKNTIAQYVRTVTNTLLALYSTRLILDALQISDYGVFSVVAGLTSMLGFITNALLVTTQRYLSFYYGKADIPYVRKIFFNSLFLHLLIGMSIGVVLFLLRNYMVHTFLNIESDRLYAAAQVYDITAFILLITILTAPFKALFVARENITYISLLEITDAFLKLVLALMLTSLFKDGDKLIIYTTGLCVITVLDLLAYIIYGSVRFEECRHTLHKGYLDLSCMKQLLGFAGWTTYGTFSWVCRSQGTALILNRFFGTAINAAYGISQQIYGSIIFISTSVLNAMNPQIMKSEGSGDRKQMLALAGQESKFSAALMAIVSIPLMVEMPALLALWLKEVPEETVMFCRAMMIAFLCDQLTLGLHSANQATGKLRTYSILMYTPKILYLPIAWIVLYNGGSAYDIMCIYVGLEITIAVIRIPFLKFTAGLSITRYCKQVIYPVVPLCVIILCASIGITIFIPSSSYSFVVTIPVSMIIGLLSFWTFTMTHGERKFVKGIINNRLRIWS